MPGQSLRVYIGYREYVTVEQITEMLNSINQIYDSLFFVEAPIASAQRQTSTNLRIGRAETGSSIVFELVQGALHTLRSVDPELEGAAGGVAVVSLTARILINTFSKGSRAFHEHQSRKLALRDQTSSVVLREQTKAIIAASLAEVSPTVRRDIDIDQLADVIGPALMITDNVLNQPNIERVAINGEVLKEPTQEQTSNG